MFPGLGEIRPKRMGGGGQIIKMGGGERRRREIIDYKKGEGDKVEEDQNVG